jgi:hypothetical protein
MMLVLCRADYKDPAIQKMLLSCQHELSPRDLFSGDTFDELKRAYGAIFGSNFSSRLAVRLASMLGKATEFQSCSHQKSFLLAEVKKIQLFRELRFTIKDHHGKVSVRTHWTYHHRRPSRAVMVRSSYGMFALLY